MNDLENRLRSLDAIDARSAPSAATLRGMAAGRRRRRRQRRGLVVVAAAMVVLVAGTLTAWTLSDDADQQVTVGPSGDSTTIHTPDPGSANRTLGGLTGVDVQVTPSRDLADGQVVDVLISGLEHIPGAVIVLCAGDVTDATADTSCDLESGAHPGSGDLVQVTATAEQQVAVARTIRISRGSPATNETAP